MKTTRTLPVLERVFAMDVTHVRAADAPADAPKRYQLTFSSEDPVERGGFWSDPWMEILGHGDGEVRLGRLNNGGPLLLEHRSDLFLGGVMCASVSGGKGHAEVQMSRNQLAQDVSRDIEDGLRVNTSVRYQIHKMKRTKRGDPEKGIPDEYRATDWEPLEVSIVSVPADATVGVGRAVSGSQQSPVEIDDGDPVTEGRTMKTQEQLEAEAAAAAEAEKARTTAANVAVAEVEKGQREKTAAEREKAAMDIIATAAANGITDHEKVGAWVKRYKDGSASPMEIFAEMLQEVRTKGPAIRQLPEAGVKHPDWRKYSYRRALLRLSEVSEPNSGARFDGLEGEYDQELRKQRPVGFKDRGGILIPMSVIPEEIKQERALERAYPLDSGTSTEGTEFKFTAPGDFIEMLRARLAVTPLGARFITGLLGALSFPRQTGAVTGTWMAEEGTVTDSMAAFDNMTLSPKTLMCTTGYTRQLLAIASQDIEAIVRADLAAVHARTIDIAAIQGLGSSNQPKGVANQSGVLSQDMGAGAGADAVPTYANLVNMLGKVADANADQGSLGYLTTPLLAATLKRTLVASAAGADMIWTGPFNDGMVAGYKAIASNDVTKVWNNGATTGGAEHGLLFGNWLELLIASWNALEVIVDPYSFKKAGRVEVTTFQMVDTGVRHPVSFCIGINAIP